MFAESISAQVGSNSRRQQMPDEVATYVRELIISGQVRPGEFLRMDRIGEAVGVSNTPVREGLLALSSQGFVRQLPHRGFVVAPFTRQDIRDLFWAQAVLAGELAARAAKKITPEQLARLDDIVKQYGAAVVADDQGAIIDLGHAYHREINLAADAFRLATLLNSVVKTLPPRFYAAIEGWIDASENEHPEIVEALRRGHAKKARTLMEQHISLGADRLIATLEGRGVWADSPGDGT
jgi:DNA-binding GntR family transcriptional regulator